MSWNPDYQTPAFDPNSVAMPTMPGMMPMNYAPYLSLMGGGMQAGASLLAGAAGARTDRANAAIAGLQAQSAEQTGGEQAAMYRQHLEQTMGKQSAQVGGANVTASGSALRALSTTAELGARDIGQIQLNAARKAWGFRVNQAGDQQQAKYASAQGTDSAVGSLITSGARAYGQWQGS
jgi:hypothetical protein